MASFLIINDITDEEVIAVGNSIRDLPRLRKLYSDGRWRKNERDCHHPTPQRTYPKSRNSLVRSARYRTKRVQALWLSGLKL